MINRIIITFLIYVLIASSNNQPWALLGVKFKTQRTQMISHIDSNGRHTGIQTKFSRFKLGKQNSVEWTEETSESLIKIKPEVKLIRNTLKALNLF